MCYVIISFAITVCGKLIKEYFACYFLISFGLGENGAVGHEGSEKKCSNSSLISDSEMAHTVTVLAYVSIYMLNETNKFLLFIVW